jgi:integrase
MLVKYEREVDRIRTGVLTREELEKAEAPQVTLEEALERFETKMQANGCVPKYIKTTKSLVLKVLEDCGIDSLADIRRDTIERWIADQRKKGVRSAQTINVYVVSLKSFVQYLTDVELLTSVSLKSIKRLNAELDRRLIRRALTKDEVDRLLAATASGKSRAAGQPQERVLVYRLLLGTGLRSTELSLLTPSQINIDKCRLTVEATKTKNKKPDVLPLRADLVQSLKERVKALGLKSHERFFQYDMWKLRRAFYGDLKAAGIERKGSDGRSIDVHSLRKTFGTLLAKAGVPLTTVQRLMRHSTPLLTAKLYIDVDPVDMMQALDQLPEFCPVVPTSPKSSSNDSV